MDKTIKTPLILVVLLLGLGLTGLGCGWLPFSSDQTNQSDANNKIGSMPTTTESPSQSSEIIIGDSSQVKPEMITVDLYFLDAKSNKLVDEKREIPKVVGMARATVEELIKGSALGLGLTSPIPLGTSLLDINVRPDGRCIVDLSREFKSNLTKGSQSETMAVYSLVNTLTQYPTVTEVQLLVDGQIVNTLQGQVDLSQPLTRSETLIKR